jgi:alkanesulfonate monooxygenase SsuD/methylene tetrahydromethanopterin reductase-like flavin-dependent oxidoreductase (luciferase family)
VAIVRESAARAGRPAPREVVQYVPCVVRDDGDEARRAAKQAVAAMLTSYWTQATASVATRTAIVEYNGLPRQEFARMMERLARGEPAAEVLDDRLLAQYAIAGTAAECLERCTTYVECGVTELGLGFIGEDGADDIARLARSID